MLRPASGRRSHRVLLVVCLTTLTTAWIDAQTDSQASHERCLAGPEGTDEQHDIAGAQARRQAGRRRFGLALTSRGDD